MDSIAEQRAYIERVIARTGWSQSELATRAGLDPSTLSRFMTAGIRGRALRASSLRKIELASGLSIDQEALRPPPSGFAEDEAEPLVFDGQSHIQAAIHALTGGLENVDPWLLKSRALENAGYRPGDILVVALGLTPVSGDVVCAQVYDWSKARAETIFRIFEPPFLVSATADRSLIRPYPVNESGIAIKGVVLHSLRGRSLR